MEIKKHIFFDLDHTLWDFDKNSALSFQKIFKEQKIDLELDTFLELYMPINLAYWKLYREEKIGKEELRYKRLKSTFDTLEIEVSDELINMISEDYIKYLPHNNFLIEGTIELLEYLKPKYELHIITNGFEEVQNLKLQKSKIAAYFDVIVTSESVGVKKPNPKVFAFALKEANITAENAIMIGDSLEADIEGAIAVGMEAIHLNLNKEVVEGSFTSVKSLLEIKQYL
ncbi:YjjG family noncanonical pyrimidine nucleotidase [Tenacibaculum amylolyticum]|uniref:YjjG family noncanonical pyrimidine nucleotidase n=1 Tax=Tenacibaculum amylolyticum TaxID=104269 RepID=UPI0038932DB1